MASRVFSEEELDRLRRFPEISREELIRFFTLTDADELFARSYRGPANVFGVAVQLCTLPWLGFVPDDVSGVPPMAAARLAGRLDTPVTELASYGQREQTRTEQLRRIARYLGWHQPGEPQWKELEEFLLAQVLEHDSPTLRFRQVCDYLIAAKVIRRGAVTLVEKITAAHTAATRETYQRLVHLLGPQRRDESYRRHIARLLNQGESLHSLRRNLFYAYEGAVRHRHRELAKLASDDYRPLRTPATNPDTGVTVVVGARCPVRRARTERPPWARACRPGAVGARRVPNAVSARRCPEPSSCRPRPRATRTGMRAAWFIVPGTLARRQGPSTFV